MGGKRSWPSDGLDLLYDARSYLAEDPVATDALDLWEATELLLTGLGPTSDALVYRALEDLDLFFCCTGHISRTLSHPFYFCLAVLIRVDVPDLRETQIRGPMRLHLRKPHDISRSRAM